MERLILDHLGNVRHKVWLKNKQWINDKGYEFKPFGESLGQETDASKGWVGLDNDYENGYKQLGHRTYDPNIGRFLQVDPLFEKYPHLSPYNYCDNRPMVLKDPLGLSMTWASYEEEKGWSLWLDIYERCNLESLAFRLSTKLYMIWVQLTWDEFHPEPETPGGAGGGGSSSSGRLGDGGTGTNGTDEPYGPLAPEDDDLDNDGIKDEEDPDDDGDGEIDREATLPEVEVYYDNTYNYNKILSELETKYSQLSTLWSSPEIQMEIFINDFKPGGNYDLKLNPLFMGRTYFNNKLWPSDNYGNFAFGFAGSIMGIDLGSLLMGAGIVQMFSSVRPDWYNWRGFFDQSNDTPLIIRGFNYGSKKKNK